MTVIYEVNLVIDAEIAVEYRQWLVTHMREMRALPGFTGARLLEPVEAEADARQVAFCTQYELTDQSALDEYLRVHAARMRADGITRFGDRFRASRRILRELGKTEQF